MVILHKSGLYQFVLTSFFILACWAFCMLKAIMALNCRSTMCVFVPGFGCHIYIELSSPNFYKEWENNYQRLILFFVV